MFSNIIIMKLINLLYVIYSTYTFYTELINYIHRKKIVVLNLKFQQNVIRTLIYLI